MEEEEGCRSALEKRKVRRKGKNKKRGDIEGGWIYGDLGRDVGAIQIQS